MVRSSSKPSALHMRSRPTWTRDHLRKKRNNKTCFTESCITMLKDLPFSFLNFKNFNSFYVLPACMCVYHLCPWGPWKGEEHTGSLGTVVTDGCALQPVISSAEPSSQHSPPPFCLPKCNPSVSAAQRNIVVVFSSEYLSLHVYSCIEVIVSRCRVSSFTLMGL